MSDREQRLAAFLAANGWRWSRSSPLADDASFRSYRRLVDGDRCAVLMDAPPPMEDIRPFARVARHLRSLGLSAPKVLAEDVALVQAQGVTDTLPATLATEPQRIG